MHLQSLHLQRGGDPGAGWVRGIGLFACGHGSWQSGSGTSVVAERSGICFTQRQLAPQSAGVTTSQSRRRCLKSSRPPPSRCRAACRPRAPPARTPRPAPSTSERYSLCSFCITTPALLAPAPSLGPFPAPSTSERWLMYAALALPLPPPCPHIVNNLHTPPGRCLTSCTAATPWRLKSCNRALRALLLTRWGPGP